MKIIHAVMAGGVGSRLWPLSRKSHPKQFLKLASNDSMIADTFLRYKNLSFQHNIIISNEEHRFLVKDVLNDANIEADIILEPKGRNTAPAAMLAALHVIDKYEDGIILLSPSDHALSNCEGLEQSIQQCIPYAEKGYICTFGITPNVPETGYGYIQTDKKLEDSDKLFKIKKFKEKPSKQKAEQYLKEGQYLWNSGIFLFKASSLFDEIVTYGSEIAKACQQAYSQGNTDKNFYLLDKISFNNCPEDSIDYVVMENTAKGIVAKIDVNWSDLGSWKSIWEFKDKDDCGNVLDGDIITNNTSNCYIKSDSKNLIATIGVSDLAIIQTNDALLVTDINKSQEVKDLVRKLKKDKRSEYINHREVHRPWGQYDSIDKNERYQVKRITVKPGHKLSVQMHYHRAEHWVVVGGTALVRKGFDKDNLEEHLLRENESIYIEIGEIHSLENPGKFPLELIEVQSGAYLGEDDIVRFSDVYGRDNE